MRPCFERTAAICCVQPRPGFTPAPATPGLEGLGLPPGFGPIPGFTAAAPFGLTLPDVTPATPTPALPGFGAVDPGLTGPQVVLNTDASLSDPERTIVGEAKAVYAAPEFERIRQAHDAGILPEVSIGGRVVQYEPGLPTDIAGMTLTSCGVNEFEIEPGAFASPDELDKTLLRELFRVGRGRNASWRPQEEITAQTLDAREFADRA